MEINYGFIYTPRYTATSRIPRAAVPATAHARASRYAYWSVVLLYLRRSNTNTFFTDSKSIIHLKYDRYIDKLDRHSYNKAVHDR